ncbi:hypothetical protein JCM16303_001303 [Sporobolomyces ruberrimus]
MDSLPLYYNPVPSSTHSTPPEPRDRPASPSASSRLSFPVSVRSLAYSELSRDSVVPPLPPRVDRYNDAENDQQAARTSRASKRGSVMLLNGPNGYMNGKGGTQQDWMRQFKPLGGQETTEEEEETDEPRQPSPAAFSNSSIEPPQSSHEASSRSTGRVQSPPSVPPRPPKYSTPTINTNFPSSSESALASPSSSAPPSMSPFASRSQSSPSKQRQGSPLMGPPPLPVRSKSPRFRPSGSSSSSSSNNTPPSSVPAASSTSSAGFGSSALSALNRGLKQSGMKDRFAAGVGFTKEWGGKGKGKLQEFASQSQQPRSSTSSWETNTSAGGGGGGGGSSSSTFPSSASSPQFDTFPHHPQSSSGPGQPPSSSSSSSIRLPAIIFDIHVPKVTGVAFGTPLSSLVASTHLSSSLPPRPVSLSPITGDQCTLYLPAIAYRCLEYLSEWGLKEEGIYRIPGRSNMVQMLKTLFDAGLGNERECDLREIHPSRLDPNAVASCFKNWLRELPESLLSPGLEASIDRLTIEHLGYTASSAHFLSSSTTTTPTMNSAPSNPPSTTTSPNPETSNSNGRRTVSKRYLEELSELFANEMPAENFYLLRAISYHLSLLASHSATNKMTLTNLRLILSPTLRLSPGFLLVLVEEREIIFGGVNQDAKKRQGATSHLVTPPLLSIPTFSPPSSSNPTSTRPSSDAPQTTPIADKFALSAIPLAPPPIPPTGAAPSGTSSMTTNEKPRQYVLPRRTDQTEGLFSSRLQDPEPVRTSRERRTEEEVNPTEDETERYGDRERERERIKSADLKLALPEGFEDSFGLGLGFVDVGRRESRGPVGGSGR